MSSSFSAYIHHTMKYCIRNSHFDLYYLYSSTNDVYSLIGVTNVLDQKCNLLEYVNVFGYLEKYGKPQNPLDKIAYFPQGI